MAALPAARDRVLAVVDALFVDDCDIRERLSSEFDDPASLVGFYYSKGWVESLHLPDGTPGDYGLHLLQQISDLRKLRLPSK